MMKKGYFMFYQKIHFYEEKVQFEDADMAGFVHHPNYQKYFERARQEALSSLGEGFEVQLARKEIFVIGENLISYKKPLKIGQNFLVVSQIASLRRSSLKLFQAILPSFLKEHFSFQNWKEILNHKECICISQIRITYLSLENFKAIPIPEDLKEKMNVPYDFSLASSSDLVLDSSWNLSLSIV